MKNKNEMELFADLDIHLQKSLDIIYTLVGDRGLPDEDVKKYFNPFFQTIPGVRLYLKGKVKRGDLLVTEDEIYRFFSGYKTPLHGLSYRNNAQQGCHCLKTKQ